MTHDANDMTGRVCLVTGATAGIGREIALALAGRGAELIIHGRDQAKTRQVAEQIAAESGNPAVHYLLADYADLDQVQALAAAFHARYNRLDVLINNAGAFFNRRHDTPYGVEKTFLVNHLAPFLLTNLLLDSLQAGAPARIINVSSDAHRYDDMDFDDLGFQRGYVSMKGYARSKLANVLFTYELARRLDPGRVTANAVHPGHVATDIWRTNFGVIGPALKWFMGLFAKSPAEGAANTIYLATSPDVAGLTGRYFVGREAVPASDVANDPAVAGRLWDISVDLTGLESRLEQLTPARAAPLSS